MHRHIDFLVLVTLATAAAATPACAQTLASLPGCPIAVRKAPYPSPICRAYGAAIITILNRRRQDRVRLSASFGGRMEP
jgi:hypothetical protein